MRALVKFEDVCKAVVNAKRFGVDLQALLVRACISESLNEQDQRLVLKYS